MIKFAFVRLENILGGRDRDIANESLGIGYLTSILREKNINVQIFDSIVEKTKDISFNLICFEPDFLGYYILNNTVNQTLLFDSALNFKKQPFKILGGQQATFAAYDLIKYEDFDAVILGEAEETLPDLIDAVIEEKPLRTIKGIVFNENGIPIFTGYRPACSDLDKLSFPARDVLEKKIKTGSPPIARVISSRGCYGNCKFCTTPYLRTINPGKTYRERSAKSVVNEIEFLKAKYGINYVFFNDDLYFHKAKKTRKRAREIAELLIKKNLKVKYKIELRPDSLTPKKDDAFLKILRKSGLDLIFAGIETGSQSMADYLNKPISITVSKKFVNYIKSHGINVNLGRIMFGPYTTWSELEDSVSAFNELSSCIQILRRPNMKLEVFPGTELNKELQKEGLLENKRSYEQKSYRFINPLVGEFHDALVDSFVAYFPILSSLGIKGNGSIVNDLEKRLNKFCYEFLIKNISMKDNWTIKIFNESLKAFINNLKSEKQ